MQRDDALHLLTVNFTEIRERYGVTDLALFGSTVRNESHADSDIDLLVEFDAPPTFDRYMDLKFFLEDLLKTRVDLATWRNLKPRIRTSIAQETIHVA